MCPRQQFLEVVHGTVLVVDLVEIADVVAEVDHRGLEDRGHPYRVHARLHEVLQLADYAWNRQNDCLPYNIINGNQRNFTQFKLKTIKLKTYDHRSVVCTRTTLLITR